VGQWVGNDDAILEGFTFTGSTNAPTTVKFPAHLGQQVQKAIKPGGNVSVTGYTETTPNGESRFRMTSLTSGKTTITDAPPVAPATAPAAPAQTTVTGKIADYRLGRDGRVNGLVLDDKTIVRVPAHVAYQLTNLATKGTTITVQGSPKSLRDGQVQLEKTNILNASVLTINGQQYLVR
jgi:ribosomal protein S8E